MTPADENRIVDEVVGLFALLFVEDRIERRAGVERRAAERGELERRIVDPREVWDRR